MSSGPSISSLFRDNSFSARSSSLFQKTFSSIGSVEQRARSVSVKKECHSSLKVNSKQKAIDKMSHILSVKIKTLQFFLFCRIETQWKQWKKQNKQSQKHIEMEKNSSQEEQQQKESIQEKQRKQMFSPVQNKQEQKIKGAEMITEVLQLLLTKADKTKDIKISFQNLYKNKEKKGKAAKIFEVITKINEWNMKRSFKGIYDRSKYIQKVDVFFDYIETTFTPKIRKVFKQIRQFSMQKKYRNEISPIKKQENSVKNSPVKKEEKQNIQKACRKQTKFINMEGFHIPSAEKLNPITEESSSFLSEEEVKFVTPEKQFKENTSFLSQVSQEKTERKQLKHYLPLIKKNTLKSSQIQRESAQKQISTSFSLHSSFSKAQVRICVPKARINIRKTSKIETNLQDPSPFPNSSCLPTSESQMPPSRPLHPDPNHPPLPDLADNIGVFESLWHQKQLQNSLNTQFGALSSHRTVQLHRNSNTNDPSSLNAYNKTLACVDNCYQQFSTQLPRGAQMRANDTHSHRMQINSSRIHCQCGEHTPTKSSRLAPTIKNVPFVTESNNDIFVDTFGKEEEQNAQKFFSSPPEKQKFAKMVTDLGRAIQKSKLNKSYLPNQTHKVALNLPRKSSFGGKFQQSSASKIGAIGSSKMMETRSGRKDNSKDAFKRYSYKDNAQHKENIEVRLWEEREKFLFYTDSKPRLTEQRKKSLGSGFSTNNQSQLTARKVQKQIQNIMNRKNRTSLGNLKIFKNK